MYLRTHIGSGGGRGRGSGSGGGRGRGGSGGGHGRGSGSGRRCRRRPFCRGRGHGGHRRCRGQQRPFGRRDESRTRRGNVGASGDQLVFVLLFGVVLLFILLINHLEYVEGWQEAKLGVETFERVI